MFDLEALGSARKKIKKKISGNNNAFQEKFNRALEFFRDFLENMDENILKKSAELFFDCLKINNKDLEPYYYLSYIFYVFDEIEMAKDYLGYAKSISTNSKEILELQLLLAQE